MNSLVGRTPGSPSFSFAVVTFSMAADIVDIARHQSISSDR